VGGALQRAKGGIKAFTQGPRCASRQEADRPELGQNTGKENTLAQPHAAEEASRWNAAQRRKGGGKNAS